MVLACSLCDYTTNRAFNLHRHISSRHKEHEPQNVSPLHQTVPPLHQTVPPLHQTVPPLHQTVPHEDNTYSCDVCGKMFTRNSTLTRHKTEGRCKGINHLQCGICKQIFNSKSSYYRHRQDASCTERSDVNQTASVINNTTNNINTTNVSGDNVQTKNTYNLLVFPQSIDSDFDFIVDNITKKVLLECAKLGPDLGFNMFMSKVLEHPENRIIMKQGPNVDYSKIHAGNNRWNFALDQDVYPILTHHMTTAALGQIELFKTKAMMREFKEFVSNINTDDESEEFKMTIKRLKLLVINITRQLEQETGEPL